MPKNTPRVFARRIAFTTTYHLQADLHSSNVLQIFRNHLLHRFHRLDQLKNLGVAIQVLGSNVVDEPAPANSLVLSKQNRCVVGKYAAFCSVFLYTGMCFRGKKLPLSTEGNENRTF